MKAKENPSGNYRFSRIVEVLVVVLLLGGLWYVITGKELIAWSKAERINTEASYGEYLEKYPYGTYYYDAKTKKKERKQTRICSEIRVDMVNISGGTFRMGCTAEQGDDCADDEHPAHEVYVSDYALNKYEVTQAQWRTIMGGDPEELYNTGCDRCPVEMVSWDDAQQFIRELNRISGTDYRLPTEAEWEYAARGGQQSRGYKYSGSDQIDAVAWYDDNAKSGNNNGSRGTTRPVGGKRANELGVYDMSGNVYEWCSDWYDGDYYERSPRNNPEGPSSGTYRVLRGGSWDYYARDCRVSSRYGNSPGFRFIHYGLRLAR